MEYIDLRTRSLNKSNSTITNLNFITTSNLIYYDNLVSITTYDNKIELIFRETSDVTYTTPFNKDKIYKIIVTSMDDKLVYSDKIYGEIIPPCDEYYRFDDEI